MKYLGGRNISRYTCGDSKVAPLDVLCSNEVRVLKILGVRV